MSNPGGKKQDDYQVYSLRNRSLKKQETSVMALFKNVGFINNPIDCLINTQAARDLCLGIEARNQLIAGELGAIQFSSWNSWDIYGGSEDLKEVLNSWKEASITSVVPFISTPCIEDLCETMGLKLLAMPGSLFELRKKFNAFELFQELKIPTPETKFLKKGNTFTTQGPIGIKPDLGAGGMDFRVASAGEVIQATEDLVLQEALDIVDSPSVQIVFKDGEYQVVVTDQLVRHNHYCGMKWPSVHQSRLEQYGHTLAKWFQRQGMQNGFLGVDFALTQDGRALAIDLNPRLTAVSFALVKILGEKAVKQVIIDQEETEVPIGDYEATWISPGKGLRLVEYAKAPVQQVPSQLVIA